MENRLKEKILDSLKEMDGKVGFCYKNLVTGEQFGYNEDESFPAASVVKAPLLGAVMLMKERGETGFREKITITDEEKVPGCGVVQHMTGDEDGNVTLDVETLCRFMIVISDNTAANAIYNHCGRERTADLFKELGFKGTQFNRAYYDSEGKMAGIENYFVPSEMCSMFERIYAGTFISNEASRYMEELLLLQQVFHKMGGNLPVGFPIAHKTGEDDDITHDVGIVYVREPFFACFASYGSDVPFFEDFIRRTTYDLAASIDPKLLPKYGMKGF